jgi:hypothetical protein
VKAILMEVRELSRLESKIPQDGRKFGIAKEEKKHNDKRLNRLGEICGLVTA